MPAARCLQAQLKWLLALLVVAHAACFAVTYIMLDSSLVYVQQIDLAGEHRGRPPSRSVTGSGPVLVLLLLLRQRRRRQLHAHKAWRPALPAEPSAGQAARNSISALTDARNIQYAGVEMAEFGEVQLFPPQNVSGEGKEAGGTVEVGIESCALC